MSECVVYNNDSGNGGKKPSPTIKSELNKDKLFDPSVDMMVNDFDDERTLEEEEALAAKESEDPQAELCSLQKEGDMPLDELLAMYGYNEVQEEGEGEGEEVEEEEEVEDEAATVVEANAEATADTAAVAVESESDCGVDEEDGEGSAAGVEGDGEAEDDDDDVEEEEDEVRDIMQPVQARPRPRQGSELARLYEPMGGEMAACRSGGRGGGRDDASRLLRSVAVRPGVSHSDEEEEDYDYSPDEDEWKKTIMVGSDYQAVIPEGLSSYGDALPYENEDKLLWCAGPLDEPEVDEYLDSVVKIAAATLQAAQRAVLVSSDTSSTDDSTSTLHSDQQRLLPPSILAPHKPRDDEQALYLLLQCGHNTDEALRRTRITQTPPPPVPPPVASLSLWSEDECRNFENGMRAYGKDFHLIQQYKVRTRSVSELVQFYYLWKKTERHDVFANKVRLEKKKYTLHPGLTDYMDRFLEEHERDPSSSPTQDNYKIKPTVTTTCATITTTVVTTGAADDDIATTPIASNATLEQFTPSPGSPT